MPAASSIHQVQIQQTSHLISASFPHYLLHLSFHQPPAPPLYTLLSFFFPPQHRFNRPRTEGRYCRPTASRNEKPGVVIMCSTLMRHEAEPDFPLAQDDASGLSGCVMQSPATCRLPPSSGGPVPRPAPNRQWATVTVVECASPARGRDVAFRLKPNQY